MNVSDIDGAGQDGLESGGQARYTSIYIEDGKANCQMPGCENIGEWNCQRNNRIYRRRLCSKHRAIMKKGNVSKHWFNKEDFKDFNCNKCEYCGWEGVCNIRRPNPSCDGGIYQPGSIRAICPNCSSQISKGKMKDKFNLDWIANGSTSNN